MSEENALWGVDLGGTKIEGVILKSKSDPQVLLRKRINTEAEQGYQHITHRIKSLLDKMAQEIGFKPNSVGIGTPGSTDPETGLLKNSNSTNLNNKPLHKDLEGLLNIPVFMANDANCFAIAETQMGIVKEQFTKAKVVFGVIMGSGVGGGLVINGKVWNGKHGIAGEWGHIFLDEQGEDCYCGKQGCVETILAGKALERYYKKISGQHKKLKDIIADREDDEYAQKTYERLIHYFGKGLSVIVNIIDPDVIIIGGGVGNIPNLYDEGLASVKRFTFNPDMKTPIVKPKLGDSAGVFGAAFLTA
ncbi:Sugar kinase of the NBD/HSP70 family, may contain an N-terminal HTH domain [Marivirga sericea]|uniref:Sugar kinase of the NBD/HSP70 family, may contain an N-terminal HTH domain n=1 Tax=Marivirga sericea TaxID=1028 RepID=A0A1X7ICS6_9BACT|nr:ROK family protein [Marivirga sericea]SMG12454.1 Sugar kinase of the NBD/HSP70 family, may contain an N-terminal HTH domain [Marivirga sericea]